MKALHLFRDPEYCTGKGGKYEWHKYEWHKCLAVVIGQSNIEKGGARVAQLV